MQYIMIQLFTHTNTTLILGPLCFVDAYHKMISSRTWLDQLICRKRDMIESFGFIHYRKMNDEQNYVQSCLLITKGVTTLKICLSVNNSFYLEQSYLLVGAK